MNTFLFSFPNLYVERSCNSQVGQNILDSKMLAPDASHIKFVLNDVIFLATCLGKRNPLQVAGDMLKPGLRTSPKDRKHMVANKFFKLFTCSLVFTLL